MRQINFVLWNAAACHREGRGFAAPHSFAAAAGGAPTPRCCGVCADKSLRSRALVAHRGTCAWNLASVALGHSQNPHLKIQCLFTPADYVVLGHAPLHLGAFLLSLWNIIREHRVWKYALDNTGALYSHESCAAAHILYILQIYSIYNQYRRPGCLFLVVFLPVSIHILTLY